MSNPDKRFLSERAKREEKAFLDAARNYMGAMSGFELDWLYRKPYDNRPGNEQFYLQAYAVMNLVRAMDIRHGGRILEVGSGPGWVSELLMLLGYDVDGIEPSADLVAVARERIERAAAHYRLPSTPNVVFHETTIESVDFELETFDAVLFHDALHHVIDERVTLETCARVLKPGGVLGIGEDAWQPGNREQESALEEEIDRFGTHESPFTCEYLDELLESCGFRDVIRYHAVNGLFPEEMGATAIAEAAQSRAEHSNTLVARKTTFDGPTSADAEAATRARIEIAGARFERYRVATSPTRRWLGEHRASEHPIGRAGLPRSAPAPPPSARTPAGRGAQARTRLFPRCGRRYELAPSRSRQRRALLVLAARHRGSAVHTRVTRCSHAALC